MKTIRVGKKRGNNRTRKTLSIRKLIDKRKQPLASKGFEMEYSRNNKSRINNGSVDKELITLFRKSYIPYRIRVTDDFYTYINYLWLNKNPDKKNDEKNYYVQTDNFRVTQDKVYNQVIELVQEYLRKPQKDIVKQKRIRNMYLSLMNLNSQATTRHLNNTVTIYEEYQEKGDLWSYIAHICSNEIVSWGCPINWSVESDQKHSDTYVNYVNSQSNLSLYDLSLYSDDNTGLTREEMAYKRGIRNRFIQYVDEIFAKCVPHRAKGCCGADVFEVEQEIAKLLDYDSGKYDTSQFYNVVKKDEARAKYGFDWVKFSKELGYKETPKEFICDNLDYLTCISTLLNEKWKTAKWRSYWIYIYFRQIIRFDKRLFNIHYEFNSKFVHGATAKFPLKLLVIFGLSLTFNTFLTEQYVGRYRDQKVIDYTLRMGYDLIEVFKRIIGRNKWMNPHTKKFALLKLKHLKLDVVQPVQLADDPKLDYEKNDVWENLKKITNWRRKNMVELNGSAVIDIPEVDWSLYQFKLIGKQSYIVNAMYTPTLNSIYIPLGYLQKPFVDLDDRGIEYNLAHIGFTLCHEMSHALDDSGSLFDYKGNLFNWWKPKDREIYERKQKDIIKQYEAFAMYDGIKFDASPSIGEDLADISGLAICEEFLKDFQDKNDDLTPIRSLSFQGFYIYYAMQERQRINKQAIPAQLKTNPHPLDKYRANVPLSRLKLFRSLYNIQQGDRMFWHNPDTVW